MRARSWSLLLTDILSVASMVVLLASLTTCTPSDRISAPADVPVRTRSPVSGATTAQPNVVVIMSDDQRADMFLNYMPLTKARLADSGVTFSKFFSNSPLCCPSRASFLSGQYVHGHGVLTNGGAYGGARKFSDTQTLATELKALGYTTGLVGKYFNEYSLLSPFPYVPPGWDEWRVFSAGQPAYYSYPLAEKAFDSATVSIKTYGTSSADYSTNRLKTLATTFLTRVPAVAPVFLVLAPFGPHNLWPTVSPTAAPGDGGACKKYLPFPKPGSIAEADVSDKPTSVSTLPAMTVGTIAYMDTLWKRQCDALQSVDRLVRDVVNTLATTGRLGNTLIIYTSDNGFILGEHRIQQQKAYQYDEATRLPLTIRWPGSAMAAVDTNLTQMVDLTATIREVAGGSAWGHGVSVLPLLSTPNVPWASGVLIEQYNPNNRQREFTAVRTHDWLYVENPGGGPGGSAFNELYDLRADPFQMKNVATDSAGTATVAALAAQLAGLRAR